MSHAATIGKRRAAVSEAIGLAAFLLILVLTNVWFFSQALAYVR
jgi:hypothetical protein